VVQDLGINFIQGFLLGRPQELKNKEEGVTLEYRK
jgi:EAL domain-containing protein (putative c-di-GMP-specific phosphodiesterase class I)